MDRPATAPETAQQFVLLDEAVHEDFHRGLSERHIQMIAIGGAIGVGLFLGSAKAILLRREHAGRGSGGCDAGADQRDPALRPFACQQGRRRGARRGPLLRAGTERQGRGDHLRARRRSLRPGAAGRRLVIALAAKEARCPPSHTAR